MKGKFKRVKTRTLGPSIRNVEAINSTRNRISQRKVFHFLLYRRSNISSEYLLFISYSTIYTRVLNTRKSIREKLHHCQRAKAWWTWRVISIIPQNKPHAHHKTHLHTTSTFVIVDVYMFITFLLFGNDVISLESRPLIFVYLHTINRLFHCIFSTFYIDQLGKVRWYHRKERLKGAVSRQSSSFCWVLPTTRPQSL